MFETLCEQFAHLSVPVKTNKRIITKDTRDDERKPFSCPRLKVTLTQLVKKNLFLNNKLIITTYKCHF